MAASYKEIATTKPFRFVIGSNATEFFAHPAIIAQHSKPLAKLMNGNMREAREGQARIEEVDENDFARCLEFCYTKDYSAADHAIVLDAASVEQEKEPAQASGVDMAMGLDDLSQAKNLMGFGSSQAEPVVDIDERPKQKLRKLRPFGSASPLLKSTTSSLRANAWSMFQDMSWSSTSDNRKAAAADQPRPNKEACEDYTDVFLSHAKIYVFADTYAIEPLRILSLQKLHRTLSLFTLFPGREDDIAILLRYTYQNTAEREVKMDELRELVLRYVSCKVEKVRSSKIFKETLRAENASSVDLIEMLLPRLD
ncbi:hypothetical protein BST61_g2445 [Cercospora zeina]